MDSIYQKMISSYLKIKSYYLNYKIENNPTNKVIIKNIYYTNSNRVNNKLDYYIY